MDIDLSKTLEKVFDSFKKVTPALVAVILFTGLIIFLPNDCLEKMKLNNLSDKWIRIISITFLVSISMVISIFICSS